MSNFSFERDLAQRIARGPSTNEFLKVCFRRSATSALGRAQPMGTGEADVAVGLAVEM
jgi:hypothetical protein